MPTAARPLGAADPLSARAFRQTQSILAPALSMARMFESPSAAGRHITVGFSWMQRLGRSAAMDLWFPDKLHQKLDDILASGSPLDDTDFPAEWAAVRQFELLQEAGNYKIYNMQADYLMRSHYEMTKNMRGGGYRVTLVTLGRYSADATRDDLAILDQRLQERLSQMIHMLYLDEESDNINRDHDAALATGHWELADALPHIGMTLGARDLFRPVGGGTQSTSTSFVIPPAPHRVSVPTWASHIGVMDTATEENFFFSRQTPVANHYSFDHGIYQFARSDEGRSVTITYMRHADNVGGKITANERRHRLAKQFFDLLGHLPQQHIVHDTAVGLQVPEAINEEEWIYVPGSDESMYEFNTLLRSVFAPFDFLSLSALDGRSDAKPEPKATVQHMRGYGDRLTPDAAVFQRQAARFTLS